MNERNEDGTFAHGNEFGRANKGSQRRRPTKRQAANILDEARAVLRKIVSVGATQDPLDRVKLLRTMATGSRYTIVIVAKNGRSVFFGDANADGHIKALRALRAAGIRRRKRVR